MASSSTSFCSHTQGRAALLHTTLLDLSSPVTSSSLPSPLQPTGAFVSTALTSVIQCCIRTSPSPGLLSNNPARTHEERVPARLCTQPCHSPCACTLHCDLCSWGTLITCPTSRDNPQPLEGKGTCLRDRDLGYTTSCRWGKKASRRAGRVQQGPVHPMGVRELLLTNVYKRKMESGCLAATQTEWQSDKRHRPLLPSLTQRESQTCDLDKFLPSH